MESEEVPQLETELHFLAEAEILLGDLDRESSS